MDKNVYWFKHDCNARDDPKCVLLIEQLGLEGYGIFWMIIETLRDQPGYQYPLILIPALARRYNTTTEKIKAVITNYHLFSCDDQYFWSDSLLRRMEAMDKVRAINRMAGLASANKRLLSTITTTVQRPSNDCSTDAEQPSNDRPTTVQRREEKRREEKKKREDKNINNNGNDFALPEWIEKIIWDAFLEVRKKKKAPNTEHALRLLIWELEKLRTAGDDPNEVIKQSIMRGYTGVFQLNGSGGNGHGVNSKVSDGGTATRKNGSGHTEPKRDYSSWDSVTS